MKSLKIDDVVCLVIGLAVAMFFVVMCLGCASITVTNTTKDGRVFEARAVSCLWDRQLKGLKFDYEKGTLEVQTLNSTPDKQTLGKALDTATSALNLATKLAL